MITIIIAGGMGTRLWPLSTSQRPKHLLRLIGERSMLQATYDRVSVLGDVYIVTERGHAAAVRQQLPELSEDAFIIEPGRRGTAHCIVMALDFVARRHQSSEQVAFVHADHHVRDTGGFVRSLNTAANVSKRRHAITLIGVEPTYPATGFGYIEKSTPMVDETNVYSVTSFKEKPGFKFAREYVASGKYLWNCGYFVGSLDVFTTEMQRNAPNLFVAYTALQQLPFNNDIYRKRYLGLSSEVIDVALIEKVPELMVVSAGFDWMDVGSFKDLHDAVERDEIGNYIHGANIHHIDVENVYVRNEESQKPIAVIGLDNIIVVNTPEGIIVARKDVSARVGEIAKRITEEK